jgi:hypothetical protein
MIIITVIVIIVTYYLPGAFYVIRHTNAVIYDKPRSVTVPQMTNEETEAHGIE